MNDEQTKLARELAGHQNFKPGQGLRMVGRSPAVGLLREASWSFRINSAKRKFTNEEVPDLTDDATGGVLWAMAGRPAVVPCECGDVLVEKHGGATLAEACARALLAQWAREVEVPDGNE